VPISTNDFPACDIGGVRYTTRLGAACLREENTMSNTATTPTVQFTITAIPAEHRRQQTLLRLMRMNPGVQGALSRLKRERLRSGNRRTARAGRIWLAREECTRVVFVEKGATFTLRMTPQIAADVKSVEKYLEAKAG
jgi:hypothetical protein